MGDEAEGRAVVLTTRIARGHRGLGILTNHHGPQGAERLERGVRARVLIGVHHQIPPAPVDGDRDDLLVEGALLLGGDGAPVRTQGELVLLRTGDPILAAQVLRRLDHAAGNRVVDAPGGHPAPSEPVEHLDVLRAGAPAHGRRVVLGLAHGLHASGEHDLAGPGLDLHGGVDDALQSRPAAPVELVAGHRDGQPGVQGGHPPDPRRLSVGVALTEEDVVDLLGGHTGARQHLDDDGRRQLGGGHVTEHPAVSSDGRPHRLADDGVSHHVLRVSLTCTAPP